MAINKNWFIREDITRAEAQQSFSAPSSEYRPNMFWFWIDDNPDPENYRRQAREMPKQGISCGYVHDRGFNKSNPELLFQCFDAALEETKKAGMVMGYCERACVLNDPCFQCGDPDMKALTLGCKALTVKQGETVELEHHFFTVSARLNADHLLDSDTLTLLSPDVSTFTATDGDYRIFPFYTYTARTTEGTTTNLLCHKATDCAMEIIHKPYLERYQKELGKTLSGHFFDLEGNYGYKLCYSRDLEEAFKARTGDDLRLICPLLLEKDTQQKYMRARYNWFDTVSELYSEYNFKKPSDELAKHDLYYYVHLWEEHLLGKAILAGDPMRIYRAVTMPGIDHLGKDYNRVITYKEVQSVCEFDGKRFANEILGCAGWELKPNELHSSVNHALSLSVSNFIPHGAYSRRDDITKARYAPDFFDWSPMWEHFSQCADTMTRGSYLISKGRMEANVLLYHPMESVWSLLGDHLFDDEISYANTWVYDKKNLKDDFEFGDEITRISDQYIRAIDELTNGHIGFLVADKYYLSQMDCQNGALTYKGRSFGAIVLPPLKILTLDNAKKLLAFAKAGGYVYSMGELPRASMEHGGNDGEMIELMACLSKQPTFIDVGDTLIGEIGQKGLTSSLEFLDGAFVAKFQKRTIDGHSFYWISNDTGSVQKSRILFKKESGKALRWNPVDGSITAIPSKNTAEGSEISYEFGLSEGFFIEFVPEEAPVEAAPEKSRRELTVDGEWLIRFDPDAQPQNPTGYDLHVPSELVAGIKSPLKEWSELGLSDFSGNIEYEIEFTLPDAANGIEVQLESVRWMATVTIDGKYEKKQLWSPYRFKFDETLAAGTHTLHIHVGNMLTNLLMPHRNDGERDFWPMCHPTDEDYRSGLTGAVKIYY